MTYRIQRVAVLGAGTMGAALAALTANVGLEVDLLDVAPSGSKDQDKNTIVKAGFERMLRAKPPALVDPQLADNIRLGNLDENFARLQEADWILEVIIEKLEAKQEMLARLEHVVKDNTIISSNTSGIPLTQIADHCSEQMKRHFLGTHFFNPPRYLKLLEIIPTAHTDSELVAYMRSFGEQVLGKGVVIAKDTPNFIGNRIGSYSGMVAMKYALQNGYGIEEVDELMGPLIGRPKTALFRLADQVGLDVRNAVAQNLYAMIPDDQFRDDLIPPEALQRMIKANLLGNKTGSGFYKRTQRDGQTFFDIIDLQTLEYHPAQHPKLALVEEAQRYSELGARLRFLMSKADTDRDACYIRDTLFSMLRYAAWRAPEIASSLADIDTAMQWGYGHQVGPFRTWDMLGFSETIEQMKQMNLELPAWIDQMQSKGYASFYIQQGDRQLVYNPTSSSYESL